MNNKQIFIINGSGGVGKDTFVRIVSEKMNNIYKNFNSVINYSSIDEVKKIATLVGWEGRKDEKDRKFLSDLKFVLSDYNDFPFECLKNKVEMFLDDNSCNSKVLFLHIREPEEIERAKKEFNAKTILIVRNNIKHITSNEADKNVFNYNYDFTIKNEGTMDNLYNEAENFIMNIILK